ncbi:MAG: hypothetical protein KF687_07530 [Cyclobacteriaceae bacterium]|nr:hypothetical protein [Cyclobacteriaceae bacterium]
MNRLIAACFFILSVGTLLANQPAQQKPDLAQQLQAIRDQSQFVDPYRMVRAYQVENFWKAVQDTLREKDEAVATIQQRVEGLAGEIENLQKAISQKENSVKEMVHAATHISFFGIDVEKGKFNWIVLATFFFMVLLTGAALLAFRVGLRSSAESKNLYEELSRDFDKYKRNTVEKEVKLYRELQDYRNRLTELRTA